MPILLVTRRHAPYADTATAVAVLDTATAATRLLPGPHQRETRQLLATSAVLTRPDGTELTATDGPAYAEALTAALDRSTLWAVLPTA